MSGNYGDQLRVHLPRGSDSDSAQKWGVIFHDARFRVARLARGLGWMVLFRYPSRCRSKSAFFAVHACLWRSFCWDAQLRAMYVEHS
jgi:hypothetical protein